MFLERINIKLNNTKIKENMMQLEKNVNDRYGGKIELVYYNNKPCFNIYISKTKKINEKTEHKLQSKPNNQYIYIDCIKDEVAEKIFKLYNNKEIMKYYLTININNKGNDVECIIAFHRDEKKDNIISNNKDKIIMKHNKKWWFLIIVILTIVIILGSLFLIKTLKLDQNTYKNNTNVSRTDEELHKLSTQINSVLGYSSNVYYSENHSLIFIEIRDWKSEYNTTKLADLYKILQSDFCKENFILATITCYIESSGKKNELAIRNIYDIKNQKQVGESETYVNFETCKDLLSF